MREPKMKCDVSEARGHVTVKSSICDWLAFCKLGGSVRKVNCLALGNF